MKFSDPISQFLQEMLTFATISNQSVFVIVDQMNRHLEALMSASTSVFGLNSHAMYGHRVLISASTSGTTTPFGYYTGRSCFELQVFDHFLSDSDIGNGTLVLKISFFP